MSTNVPENDSGLGPVNDLTNVQVDTLPDSEQTTESLEYAYALLARSPLPAVSTPDEF